MLNIEKLVIDHLNNDGTLGAYPASLSIPTERPERFITVERVGGRADRYQTDALMSVQVWESSRWNASDAANRLIAPSLLRLIDETPVGDASIQSMLNNPDPISGQARTQITMLLHCAIQ